MIEKLLDRKTTNRIQVKLTNYPDHKRSVLFQSKITPNSPPQPQHRVLKNISVFPYKSKVSLQYI